MSIENVNSSSLPNNTIESTSQNINVVNSVIPDSTIPTDTVENINTDSNIEPAKAKDVFENVSEPVEISNNITPNNVVDVSIPTENLVESNNSNVDSAVESLSNETIENVPVSQVQSDTQSVDEIVEEIPSVDNISN